MMNLELSDLEVTTVGEVFESYLSDLRMEIAGTDKADFRDGLKERKEVLEALLQRLKAGHA